MTINVASILSKISRSSMLNWCRKHDPGLMALRRGSRAALLMPVIFFTADKLINSTTFALFASFGSLTSLLLVSFSGTKRQQLIEAGAMICVELIFLCIGTVASKTTWLAVIMSVLITFIIFYIAIVKPSIRKMTISLLISLLLPITVPGTIHEIPGRFLAWFTASAISLLAIIYLWPITKQDKNNEVSLHEVVMTAHLIRNSIKDRPELYVERLRHAIRTAIALGLAVLATHLFGAQHALWVILGSLTVLCSSAANTGQKVESALVGTIIGIVFGSGLIAVIGSHITICWVLLPVSILFTSFAPVAISFMAGQVGFTTLLLLISNITTPIGWRVGVIRLEDIIIGCVVSLFVGTIFWPRGTMLQTRKATI
jgi:uncharacterized membrane protein YccC